MTDAEKDAAWRSLPDDSKDEVKRRYAPFANWGDDCRCINTEVLILEDLFGKHNLTASEEEKPKIENKARKINVGDIVRVRRETPCNLYNNMPYAFVDMPFFVTEIEQDCDNGLNDVAHLRNGSTCLNIHPHWLQKEDIHHKWETKDSRQDVVDMTLKTWLNSTPDWLAYRMELAKEVVNGLLFTGKSPETIADETTAIVDGIVERLKGGEK